MKKTPNAKTMYLYCFLIISLLLSYSVSSADFNEIKGGVRPIGLGGAFVGIADDDNSLFLNPAGIARLEFGELGYTYGRNYPANDTKKKSNYFSLIYPIGKKAGTIGIGWANYYAPSIPNENTFILSYARKSNDLLPFLKGNFYIGTNLKALCSTNDDTTKDIFDELFNTDDTESAFDFDFATLYNATDKVSFGLVARNILEPSVRGEEVHRETILGAKYNLGNYELLKKISIEEVTTAIDIRHRDKKWKGHAGIEAWFFNYVLGTRIGANDDEAACGLTLDGMATKYFDLEINYSFTYSLDSEDKEKTHYIGLNLTGKSKLEEKEEAKEEKEAAPYLLGPKDEIQIFVRRHAELSGNVVINPEGKISLPLLGDVDVTGLSKVEIANKLKTLLTKYIENPDVIVNIVRYRSKEFYVLGEVRRPGKYAMEGSIWTVKDAIAQAGFTTGIAATWRVYIITPRSQKPIYTVVNLYKILYLGKLQQNIQLKPGDIVYVPTTVLGKISASLSHLLDPFFKTRDLASPVEEGSLLKKGIE